MNLATCAGIETGARHPLREACDGDFAVASLLALPCGDRPASITTGEAARLMLDVRTAATDDRWLLHAMEAGPLLRVPMQPRARGLTRAQVAAWAGMAADWIDRAMAGGDLRLLNTACKLIGGVWLYHRERGDAMLAGQLGFLGRRLDEATTTLATRLQRRLLMPAEQFATAAPAAAFAGAARARLVVLTPAGSRSGAQLVSAAAIRGLPIAAVCWYSPRTRTASMASNYATAWYPVGLSTTAEDSPPEEPAMPVKRLRGWNETAAVLRAVQADVVVLAGMPIVPVEVLDAARVGVVNAHNGMLPGLRGMDAIGWAVLTNQPIVCTLHRARPQVDSGEIIASEPVALSPAHTLHARVKVTQTRMLLRVAEYAAATGQLPDATPQHGKPTQYYRLHPHLKRVLDASPYNHDSRR